MICFFLVSDCHDRGFLYSGEIIQGKYTSGAVYTAMICYQMCWFEECDYFSYDSENHKCSFLRSVTGKVENSKAVSGKRLCTESGEFAKNILDTSLLGVHNLKRKLRYWVYLFFVDVCQGGDNVVLNEVKHKLN